ncbi:transcription/translation regulatory transformer protein RfaH [Stutzerimonas tarimensis]|uniref:Transcription/translation regulatory transformer protein RfaH n=1 Tax=Stutzerimonas tarimensis TaxID=1507735 RepID=A0ABV7T7H9_9GAMM
MASPCQVDSRRNWYLLQCKARQDERGQEHLARQGYEIFRPLCLRERLVRGQRQVVEESLFPGYLFICLGDDGWGPLRSTRGVLRVVNFGGRPLPVDERVIAQLRSASAVTQACLSEGDRVRISEGPFAELEAIFLRMDGTERVVLLLDFMERSQPVRVPLKAVRKD